MRCGKRKQIRQSTLAIALCLIAALPLLGNTLYIQAKAHLAQHLIDAAWADTVRDNHTQQTLRHPHKPWMWADSYPVATLRVPAHNVEQTVLDGATGSALAFAPGLYAGTQLPDEKKERPNTVIAGHHNTHFDFLKRIKLGETVQLQTFQGNWQTYHVSAIETFDIRTQQLPALTGGDTVQLVTCLPRYLGELHPNERLVVTATHVKMMDKNMAQH